MPAAKTVRKTVFKTTPEIVRKPALKTTPATTSEPPKILPKPVAKPIAEALKTAVSSAPAKVKQKLVRDSFTIPKIEYLVLEGLKLRAANLKRPARKSEVLRAGVAALNAMGDKAFLAALASVPSLKTGRPKGDAQ